jgi:phosphomannomutase
VQARAAQRSQARSCATAGGKLGPPSARCRLERIALAHGARFVRSATGFKWIAALARESAQREGRELLFGYEEALGYSFRRQDGIVHSS